MRTWISGLARLLAIASFSLLPAASHAGVITLRTSAQEGTAPKFIAADKGRVAGLCIDILRAIEQIDPGLRFTGDQQWKPLIRSYSELEAGMADVQCAMQRIPEREKKYRFIGPVLYRSDYHFLVRSDDPLAIHSWDDVRRLAPNNVVLVNRGFAAADIVASQGGIELDASSTSPELNLQKLIAGRGRLYFHRSPGLERLLERTGSEGKVRILPQVMYTADLYFATSRQLDREVSERIADALFQLEKKGELARLVHKWD